MSRACVAWPGRSDRGSVVLPLASPALPQALVLPEGTFTRKHEFHLTLLSTREAEALAPMLEVAAWQAAFEAFDWTLALAPRWHLLRERDHEGVRMSVIAEATCPALNAFRHGLQVASGAPLPDTLPHVTLYTLGAARGIGLGSLAEFEALRVREVTPG